MPVGLEEAKPSLRTKTLHSTKETALNISTWRREGREGECQYGGRGKEKARREGKREGKEEDGERERERRGEGRRV